MRLWFDWGNLPHGPGSPEGDEEKPLMTATRRAHIIDLVGAVDPLAGGVPPNDLREGTIERERFRAKREATGLGFAREGAMDAFIEELAEAFWHGAEPNLRPRLIDPIPEPTCVGMLKELRRKSRRRRRKSEDPK